jgi:hypothetical protein
VVLGTNLIANSGVSQESLQGGIKLANLADKGTGKLLPQVETLKTLEQGCSTTIVAALDLELEGMVSK